MRKNIAKIGAIAGVVAGLVGAPGAYAASGETDVSISFPDLIILYYYSAIDINLSAANMGELIDNVTTECTGVNSTDKACASTLDPLSAGTVSGTKATYDADITGAALTSTDFTFDIQGAWAVRALTGGTLTATASGGTGDFTAVATDTTAPTASLTLGGGNIGNVKFNVDMTTVQSGGTMSASDTITIAVNAAP
ncbi:MAG: hypothetical protein HOC23_15825 [Halieaceae bacterium]|jgi:hypothetical protein|nr:hypothetical protein [Halieaceae bacterium]